MVFLLIFFYLLLSSSISPCLQGKLSLRKSSKVSDEFQKCEGDVRENEYPSRAFSPLYIGLCSFCKTSFLS